MIDNGTPAEKVSHRRSLRRWLVRAVLLIVLFLVIAYASLPWWFPTKYVTGRLGDELSAALNRGVHIGRLSLGWRSGVVIEDLTITDSKGDRKLAKVDRIRCGLTPLTTLWTGRVDRIDILKPQLWIEIDDHGRTSLQDLSLPTDGGLPSLEYSLTGGICHVITPEVSQVFQIDRLVCKLDQASGSMRLIGGTGFEHAVSAQERVRSGRLSMDVQLTVPQLNRSLDLALTGRGRVVWNDLALNDLPIPVAARLPIEQVDGVSTGRVTFHAHPDLNVDFDMTVGMKGVRIRHDQFTRAARIPDADLQCNGHWDPHTDTLALTAATYESRAIRLMPPTGADGPMLLLDPQGGVSVQAQFAGEIRDWDEFRSEFPRLDAWLEKMRTDIAGSAMAEFTWARTVRQDRIAFDLDAEKSHCHIAGSEDLAYLHASADIDKRVQVGLVVDRGGRLSSLQCRADIGQTHLSVNAATTSASTETQPGLRHFIRDLPDWTSHIELQTDQLDELMAFSPWLTERCRVEKASGSFALQAHVVSDQDESRVRAVVNLPDNTALHVADVFNKPVGDAFEAQFRMSVPHQMSGRIDRPQLTVTHDDAQLVIGGESAFIDYKWIEAENDAGENEMLSLAYRLPFDATAVDSLLMLLPQYIAFADAHDVRDLSGSARGNLQGEGRWQKRAWTSRCELDLDADELAGRWGEYLDKQPETPLHVTLRHDLTCVDDREYHSHLDAVVQSNGEIRLNLFACSGEAHPTGSCKRSLEFEAHLDDLSHWLSFSPAIADALKPYAPRGALTIRAMATRHANNRFVSLYVDATQSSFDLPEELSTRRKPAGESAVLHAQMTGTNASADRMRWQLTVDPFQLGGLMIDDLTGTFTTPSRTTVSIDFAQVAQEMEIVASGQVLLDELLTYAPAEALPRCVSPELTGSLSWQARCVVRDQRISLTGWIDAVEAEWSCALDNAYVSELRKVDGLPMLLSFDLGTSLDSDGPRRIDVYKATLDLAGNTVRLNGWVEPWAETPEPAADLQTEIDVANGGAIALLWPNGVIGNLEGRLLATTHLSGSWRKPTIASAEVSFEQTSFNLGTKPVELDGKIVFEESHIDLDTLRVGWGTSTGAASGHIERVAGAYVGRLGLVVDRFDSVEWVQLLERLPHGMSTASAPASIGEGRSRAILTSLLNQCQLHLDVETKTCHLVLPPEVSVEADCVSLDVHFNRGTTSLSFAGLVDGGYVHGTVDTRTDVDQPVYFLQYTAERIWPGPVVDAFLTAGFPGFKATGPLTLIDESYQKLRGNTGEFETGKGEFSVEGGSIEGRAAPRWVTRIFPGLNLARFEFTYMHSWFEKLASGRVRHKMIFQGQFYNVYMDGHSDRDQTFNYEIGIDFLADFDSKYWASSGQGRIPLFTKTGQVAPDGTILDERVTYEPPQRILDVLLVKNNPVVTAYHAVRQQVLGQE